MINLLYMFLVTFFFLLIYSAFMSLMLSSDSEMDDFISTRKSKRKSKY